MGAHVRGEKLAGDMEEHLWKATAQPEEEAGILRVRFEWAQPNLRIPTRAKGIKDIIRNSKNKWLMECSEFPDEGREVAQGIIKGTVIGVSDCSYMEERSKEYAAAAWVLECQETGATCWETLAIPGDSTNINPYRAELFGILAMRTAIKMLQERWQLEEGMVELYVNNKKVG